MVPRPDPHPVMSGARRLVSVLFALAAFLPAWRTVRADGGVRVTFLVQAPPSTPGDAALWIAGGRPELGAWNGAGVRLAPRGGGLHAATVTLPAGAALEFKITRGAWETVEKDAAGGEIGNRTHQVGNAAAETLRVAVATWRDQVEGPTRARTPTLSGRIDHHPRFPSAHVRPRDIWVYLPPGYDGGDATRRYPVLYFHDGNNVFDAATSFLGVEWGVDEVAERDIPAGRLPPFIAVAVANTPDRIREYTWALDDRRGGGGAADYARFLIEELKPFVDRAYRTEPGPAATGVVGSSLGGIVSLWLGLEHPDVFRRIGCVSPAAGWVDRDLARIVRAGTDTPLRVWLDTGTAEVVGGGEARWLDDVRHLRDALVARGYRTGHDLHYEEIPGAPHNERAWAARVDRMLAFLLSDPTPAVEQP